MIDLCAGICYGRKELTKDSKTFVERMIGLNHTRTLEFGTVYLKFELKKYRSYQESLLLSNENYVKVNQVGQTLYVTTNYRFLFENDLLDFAKKHFCEEPSELHYKRKCFHIVASRAIIDECRTHSTISGLVESTRWINYSKDKFGNELTYIKPYWASERPAAYEHLLKKYAEDEKDYFVLLGLGCKPQEARDALPLGVKSETYMCGFYNLPDKYKNTRSGWDMFIFRRLSRDAHEDIQWIAKQIDNNIKDEEEK
jgi:thymidylate synthase (FAD)